MRINFPADDAARFNALRDNWRSAAASCALPMAAMRIASVLPEFINREFGYAFPTDRQLAEKIGADVKTAKRGISSLADAGLIERETQKRQSGSGKVDGKNRRIFLALPKGQNQASPKGQKPKGQKTPTEGTPVCPYILDNNTPDSRFRSGRNHLGAYVPAREEEPVAFRGDTDFLDEFDRRVMAVTDGKLIGAGQIDFIVQTAFDQATDSSDRFMPVHWREICSLRSDETANWFIRRVGALIHRRAA